MSAKKKAETLANLIQIHQPDLVVMESLDNAVYTMNEGSVWPDDVEVSTEQCVACWQLIEYLKANGGLPSELVL